MGSRKWEVGSGNNRRGEACLARHRGMIKAAIQRGIGITITIGRGVMEQKYILRLKVLEILRRYNKVQQHFHMMREWKKRWIFPN